MRIKSELIWGESIREPSKIYDLLVSGKLPYGYYLLLGTADGRIEFISAKMQHNRYFESRDCTVFGIAHGKKEAYDMVRHILTQIYVEHVYESVTDFVREVAGDTVC